MVVKENSPFGSNFIWGVATSAFQIEGASAPEQRGRSVWDEFCRRKEAIMDSTDGSTACDHFNRYPDDVELISQLEARAYRFSVSWPRVLPHGVGRVNTEGLDFYDRLVDKLLSKGINPWVTLFHWDFPLDLYYQGGWLNRDSSDWFADYAAVVVDRLSDRVSHWISLNEPQCYMGLGHHLTVHAPGLRYSDKDLLRCIHNTLLAHGKTVQVIRARSKKPSIIGWSPVGWVTYPCEANPQEIELARKTMFSIDMGKKAWPLNNSWYSDPVVLGKYPEEGEHLFGADYPTIAQGDMETIQQPLDFYGVNIYHGAPITIRTSVGAGRHSASTLRKPGYPTTQMGWTIDPQALYWGPKFLWERYKLPIYVTENGIATMDWITCDGTIPDKQRIDYVERHLANVARAKAEGIDIRGYFLWSLMDNFEWELGYSRRFGLIYVDYETQRRQPKESYYWYRDTIAKNGANIRLNCTHLH